MTGRVQTSFASEMVAVLWRSLFVLEIVLLCSVQASDCSGAPAIADSTRQTYSAPIQANGWDCGSSTIVYWLEPSTRSPSEKFICWTCTFQNSSATAFGGTLLLEIADGTGGTDWMVGEKHLYVGAHGTASVADTASQKAATATRLGAPHWHLLCHGSDMPFRCGPVKRVSG
jgi:hypothetical protein